MSNTDRDVMGMNLFQTNDVPRQEYAFSPVQPEHNFMGLTPTSEASLLQAIREQNEQRGSQQNAAVFSQDEINNQMNLLRVTPNASSLEEVDSLFRSFHTRIKLLERKLDLNTQLTLNSH